MRDTRDAQLAVPKLILPSVQALKHRMSSESHMSFPRTWAETLVNAADAPVNGSGGEHPSRSIP